jgi:hypothetical protein
MTPREKKILGIAIAVGTLFTLVQGFPVVRSLYGQRAGVIEQIQTDIAREARLIEDSQLWRERRATIEDRLQALESQVFQGGSVPMLSANIQQLVREYANQSGISVTSTKLAESMQTEGWVLVEQELTILTQNQDSLLRFLRQIDVSTPWLGISTFSMRRNRNQYAGTITVVGFSKIQEASVSGPAG